MYLARSNLYVPIDVFFFSSIGVFYAMFTKLWNKYVEKNIPMHYFPSGAGYPSASLTYDSRNVR